MMLVISSELIEKFGGKDAVESEVQAFAKAIDAHRFTVGVPAPTASDLVEHIVREHSGKFSIAEPVTEGVEVRVADEAMEAKREADFNVREEALIAAKNGDLVSVVEALLKLIG